MLILLAVLKANFSFWNAKALFPSFLRDRNLKKKKKIDEKPTSQLIPATKKEDLSFLVRFQFMKGRTSLADVLSFYQTDFYLLGFICQQIFTM